MKRSSLISLLLVTSALLSGCGSQAVQEGGRCTGAFEASVRSGPDAGLSLGGELQLRFDQQGRLRGALVLPNGRQIGATGQTVGQAISLLFDVQGKKIFGVGTLESDLKECTGVSGGPLSGPEPGDNGDWLFKSATK